MRIIEVILNLNVISNNTYYMFNCLYLRYILNTADRNLYMIQHITGAQNDLVITF